MKTKIIQILLGAVGSLMTVVLAHYANATPDVIATSGLGGGALTTFALGGWADAAFNGTQG